jgi:hypothetical protein
MPFTPPLSESMPRLPEPHASQNFYYAQVDHLAAASKGKGWKYCEIRPDMIVGFVPNNNIYCLAQTLATYLSLYAAIEGPGAKCEFPGTEKSWLNKSNDSSQDIVAKFAIYASLHPETTHGEAYNAAEPGKYIEEHLSDWRKLERENGLQTGRVGNERSFGGFQYFIMTMLDFDRELDMRKMHQAWGSSKEETDVKGAWWTAFDRFRKAKIILFLEGGFPL